MANTSVVYVRIDSGLKDHAEVILSQLGISPSSAIQMFYSQIILQQGMPFDLRLSVSPQQADAAAGSSGAGAKAAGKPQAKTKAKAETANDK